MKGRQLLLGVVLAAAYVAVTVGFNGEGPVLPLYEIGPINAPYRWVDPPPDLAEGNIPPEGTKQEVAMTDVGTVQASVITPDGQAAIVFRQGAFPKRLGEIAVMVDVQPKDPKTLGEPPPQTAYDGNAYVVTAVYAKDGSTAELVTPATVVMKAPLGGTRLLRQQPGSGWVEVSEPTAVPMSLQVFGEATRLGTFVAAVTIHGKPFPTLPVSLGASGVAVIAALYFARRRGSKRPPSRRHRRAAAQGKTSGPASPSRTTSRRKKRR